MRNMKFYGEQSTSLTSSYTKVNLRKQGFVTQSRNSAPKGALN